jgi:hypothetical protein
MMMSPRWATLFPTVSDQHETNYVSPASTRFQPDIQSLASSALLFLTPPWQVPGYESDRCRCGTGQETLRHVLLDCPDEEERRELLRESRGRLLDFRKLVDTNKGARVASR